MLICILYFSVGRCNLSSCAHQVTCDLACSISLRSSFSRSTYILLIESNTFKETYKSSYILYDKNDASTQRKEILLLANCGSNRGITEINIIVLLNKFSCEKLTTYRKSICFVPESLSNQFRYKKGNYKITQECNVIEDKGIFYLIQTKELTRHEIHIAE